MQKNTAMVPKSQSIDENIDIEKANITDLNYSIQHQQNDMTSNKILDNIGAP